MTDEIRKTYMESMLREYLAADKQVKRGKGRQSITRGVSFSKRANTLLSVLTSKLGKRYVSETIEEALILLGTQHGVMLEDLTETKDQK